MLSKKSLVILSSLFLISACSSFPKINNYAINAETEMLICNQSTMPKCVDLPLAQADNYLAVDPDDLQKITACQPINVIFLCAINATDKTLVCYRESDGSDKMLTLMQANNYFSVSPDDYAKLLDYRKKKCKPKP